TTEGIIATLQKQDLKGKNVGVQLYSPSNPPLMGFLAQAGATGRAVLPYVYAAAADADRVAHLIKQMADGAVDVLVFTSSPQVDRLFEVAEERHVAELLRQGLGRTRVAAIGPVVADNLRHRGAKVAVCPEQGFVMKNLVLQVKRDLEQGKRLDA